MPAPVTAPSAPAQPAAGATPAPSAPRPGTPAPDLERPQESWLDEVGNDLQELSDEGDRQAAGDRTPPKPKPQRQEPDRPADGEPADGEPAAGAEPEPGGEPEPGAQPEAGQPQGREADVAKMTAPELRKAHKALQQKVNKELQPTIQRLEKELKEARSRPAGESEEQKAKYAALEKRIAEQEATIRFTDYQKSEEFRTKYQEPYVKAWNAALRDITDMEVELAGGGTRKATEDDLVRLGNLPLQKARTEANAMFGDSADDVMYHVRQLKSLASEQSAALERAQTEAQKRAQEEAKTAGTRRAERIQKWNENNQALATKYPAWFAKAEADPEGNTLLDKGFALVDLIFSPQTVKLEYLPPAFANDIKTNDGKLSPDMQNRLHALIRNKAAGFDRLARYANMLKKELAEAKKSLAEFENSEPPAGGGARGGTGGRGGARQTVGVTMEQIDADIDELDRKGGRR